MAISEQGGYQCPACGYCTTIVRSTASYDSHITRKRECVKCGHVHSTSEMRVDFIAMLDNAHRVTKQFETNGGENTLLGANA